MTFSVPSTNCKEISVRSFASSRVSVRIHSHTIGIFSPTWTGRTLRRSTVRPSFTAGAGAATAPSGASSASFGTIRRTMFETTGSDTWTWPRSFGAFHQMRVVLPEGSDFEPNRMFVGSRENPSTVSSRRVLSSLLSGIGVPSANLASSLYVTAPSVASSRPLAK